MSLIIEIDGRSRVTLPGKAGRRYLVTEDDDGTVTLQPAVVMSELEARALRDPAIAAALLHGRGNPQDRLPRPPRRTS